MSWTDVDLTTVPTGLELLPKGTYTFSILPGAKFSERDPGKVEFQLAVASGEFAGKRTFASYPNPSEYPWSKNFFARMIQALGADAVSGESPVEYLNRNANLHVELDVEHKTDKEGVTRVQLGLAKPRPAKN